MKRIVYLSIIMGMTLCLAACGKAVSSCETETEEIHQAYVIEGEEPESVESDVITVLPEKINVALLQSSNTEPWQVMQTESFYMAFTEDDGYHLNIVDAHGDSERQTELFHQLIEAPMDVVFIVPTDPELIENYTMLAEDAGILLFFLESGETNEMDGNKARQLLEE